MTDIGASRVGTLVGYKLLYAGILKVLPLKEHSELRELTAMFDEAHIRFAAAAKRAFAAAVDAPLNECAEFFNGVGRVFQKRKPKAITEKQKTLIRTQNVYLFMLVNWKNIPTGITSKELFEWLDKRLPPEVMGTNPDWIRGICTRIKFPRAREGRPATKKRS
jgi:hypothetical protein